MNHSMFYTCLIIMSVFFSSSIYAQKAPYLNSNPGGLPPFFASMQKHEVMVTISVQDEQGKKIKAPKGLAVGFRILAQGQKIRDYHEQTDDQGRAFFLGIPSNPKVQMSIGYEVWVDYQGVRFPFQLDGIPSTVDKDVLYEDFDPSKRLPENRVALTILNPSKGIDSLTLHHDTIEFQADEESVIVFHDMTLKNNSSKVLDLSHQPQGGLRMKAPEGAKHLELRHKQHEDLEVRGGSLYYIGALLPWSEKRIRLLYTFPYRSETLEWKQSIPIPTTFGNIVSHRSKKAHHQKNFPISLIAGQDGDVQTLKTDRGLIFHSLRVGKQFKPGENLSFKLADLPIPPPWKRYALWSSIALVIVWILFMGLSEPKQEMNFSRTHLMVERDRLLKTLARMELALSKKKMSKQRYQREKEIITARLVTLYRALDQVDQN